MRFIVSLLLLLAASGAMAQPPAKKLPAKAPVYTSISPAVKYRLLRSTAKVRGQHTNMSVVFATHYRMSVLSTDSVLSESFSAGKRAYIPINEPSLSKVFVNLMAGDSAEVIYHADSFFNSAGQPRPHFIKAGDRIRFIFRVYEILTQEQMSKLASKEQADAIRNDSIAMMAAVQELNATSKTPEGVYYKVLKPGNGTRVKQGDRISVRYLGKLLNGRIFDQNQTSGIQVTVGSGGVIQGWESMLSNMEYGQKVITVIPYKLAYGDQGHPAGIPAYSTLTFEMEILEK